MDLSGKNIANEAESTPADCFGIKRSHVQIVSPRIAGSQVVEKTCGPVGEKSASNSSPIGQQGGQQTLRRVPISQRKEPHSELRTCRACPTKFRPSKDAVSRGMGFYCSQPCRSKAPKKPRAFFTPESTKAERIRANGLVNKREKLGHFKTPSRCQLCGEKCKLDKHHPDYTKPNEIVALCRSCHTRAHLNPSIIAGIKPIDTTRQIISEAA